MNFKPSKSLKELKNLHKGEDIWLLLAGSSMDYVNPSFFKNKITIGQNQLYKHFPCTYALMKDCLEQPRFPRSINELNELNIPLIYCEYYKGYKKNPKNIVKHNNSYFFTHNPRKTSLHEEINLLNDDDIVVSASTVTSLMHTAAYMGAKNIILCGHDCGTLDNNLYYDGYMENDWISSQNWSGIKNWMSSLETQSQLVRNYLMKKYNCNIYSLNPFLNLGLENHTYIPT